MRVGKFNKWVTLSNSPGTPGDADGFFEPLDPEGVWASIDPQGTTGEGRTMQHLVGMRYHPQVTMDTRIVYGTRELFVKGFQNVAEQNVEMLLLCEEVIP